MGQGGRGYYSGGSGSLTFTFDQRTLGWLPTHVGIVWTDFARNQPPGKRDKTFGCGTVLFEAFDGNGKSLGSIGPFQVGDGDCCGTTAEDRFFGVVFFGGVSAIKISMLENGGFEVDHLQYGMKAGPPVKIIKQTEVLDDVIAWAPSRPRPALW